MLVTDFDYDLPQELIAQHPMEPRDIRACWLLTKKTGEIEHKHFYDLVNYLKPGDVLVFNDTRVIPARCTARRIPVPCRGISADPQQMQPTGRFWCAPVKSCRLVPRLTSAMN